MEEEIDRRADTFALGENAGGGIRSEEVVMRAILASGNRIVGPHTSGNRSFVAGLTRRGVEGREAVPMPVFQPRPQRVQAAVIVHRIACTFIVALFHNMSVSVEQALDLQYLLQLGQRPPVPVVHPRITPVLFRQEIRIVRKPFIPADVRCNVCRSPPTDFADVEREAGRKRKHVVAQTVRLAVTVEILKSGRTGEFHDGAYPPGDAALCLHAV